MARQNVRLPILTWVSLGLREARYLTFRPTIRGPVSALQAEPKRANAKE
ncbi:MAG: hypothetical protein EWM73_01027 [Nitrospira sp.]|nr:MAG: hypothetical protein EWM73_01027 [Nitrospira sp.]